MDDNFLSVDEILKQFGDFENLRIENILDSNDDDDARTWYTQHHIAL